MQMNLMTKFVKKKGLKINSLKVAYVHIRRIETGEIVFVHQSQPVFFPVCRAVNEFDCNQLIVILI